MVFSPSHWRSFRLWYSEKTVDNKYHPIIKGRLITNDWYVDRGDSMWIPWFMKYAHEMVSESSMQWFHHFLCSVS